MKENIINVLKFFTMMFVMTLGFWLIYCLIWIVVGLPLTNWAVYLLMAVAGLTEYGYFLWVSN